MSSQLPPPELPDDVDPRVIKVLKKYYDDDEIYFLLFVRNHGIPQSFSALPSWYIQLAAQLKPLLTPYISKTIADRLQLYNSSVQPHYTEIDKVANDTALQVAKKVIDGNVNSLNRLLQAEPTKDELSNGVKRVFDIADKQIGPTAQFGVFTAIHQSQQFAAITSGLVAKLVWKTAIDPCEYCFSMDGTEYNLTDDIPIPAHPSCKCGTVEILRAR